MVSDNLPLAMTYRDAQLDALGNPTRRHILHRLRVGPLSVAEISHGASVTRPAISQHLKVLKDAGLVVDKARGTRREYELNPSAFASLREYFDEYWGVALIAFAREVGNRAPRNHPATEE